MRGLLRAPTYPGLVAVVLLLTFAATRAMAQSRTVSLVKGAKEIAIDAGGERIWTLGMPGIRRPAADPKTMRTRAYLSSGNRGQAYSEAGTVVLALRARSHAERLAGAGDMLGIAVNGRTLTAANLLGRGKRFKTRSGYVMPSVRKNTIFYVYHAPSFKPIPRTYKYYPLDLPNHDPFAFKFDVTSLVGPGENTLTIRNVRKPPRYTNRLIVADVRIVVRDLDELLAERADKLKAKAEKMRAVVARLYDDIPTLGDTARMLRVIGSMRMTNWGAANSSPMTEYDTPAKAAANAARIRRDGATVAIVRGRHFRLDYADDTETKRLMDFYELTARACKKEGVVPFAHLDFTLFWQPGYRVIFKHPDWPQVSLDDGTPHHWCCTNNPGFREAHIRYVEEIARRGIEGFMLDEINFAHKGKYYCGCRHCRRRFEEVTGYRIPEYYARDFIGNTSDPLWRLWGLWQSSSIVRFKAEMLQRLRRINPHVVMVVYSTNVYFPARSSGTYEQGRVCFIGTEGTNRVYGGYANLFAQHRISAAFARRWGRPSWSQYPCADPEERVWSSGFFAPVVGNTPWGWRRYHHDMTMRGEFTWPYIDEAFIFAEPVADIAVMLSTANRWGPSLTGTLHAAEASGWCQAFGLRGVQFDPLPALHLRYEDLKKFKAIIVPHAVAMPRPALAVIKRYVREGGTVVITGVAGRFDRLGFPHGREALFHDAGLRGIVRRDNPVYSRYKGTFHAGVARRISISGWAPEGLARSIALPEGYRFDPVPASGVSPRVLASFEDGAPAMITVPREKGRYIHLAFLPGLMIYQQRMRKRAVAVACLDPQTMDLMRAIAREATGHADRITVDGAGIQSSAWRRDKRVWVRMVNSAGAKLKPGEKVADLKVTYPKLGPIRIAVRMPVKATALLMTPDRKAPVEIGLIREGDHRVIIIPADTFKRFALVRMEMAQ